MITPDALAEALADVLEQSGFFLDRSEGESVSLVDVVLDGDYNLREIANRVLDRMS